MLKNKQVYSSIRNTSTSYIRWNLSTTLTSIRHINTKLLNSENRNIFFELSWRKFYPNTNFRPIQTIYLKREMSQLKTKIPKHTNRLVASKSPYLLQHAHNPVDWYPWCEEAFQRARQENKLIFLSVGYSTCHWCHVMEHESFEDEKVAEYMNETFVNIKVDREERPDIDKIYMQFLLMTKGSGGWPMSVWLTPDLAPIMAGTYYPPKQRWSMPSFIMVLKSIASKWETDKESIKSAGASLIKALESSVLEKESESPSELESADDRLQEALRVYKQRYDVLHGGFGFQPKFPEVSRLNFIHHAYIATKDADVLDMAVKTLEHIGNGGINDHVFGGIARYAVDNNWHVPHFEKMLYDQGQLMSAYASAYKLTHNEKFLNYADSIFRYIMKDLRHPLGGFYSGEDADSLPTYEDTIKVEGAFYAWHYDEIKKAIEANAEQLKDVEPTKAFEIYAYHYSILEKGNVKQSSDPHGHLAGKNILIVQGSFEKTCSNFNISADHLNQLLNTINGILHGVRDKRPRPHLDTKIICAWNGLVLSGLSKLANCGGAKRNEYIAAAQALVNFVKSNFYIKSRKILTRSCYGIDLQSEALETNNETIDGFLDDYAFMIRGLLDYYKASMDGHSLHWAKKLQDIQDANFWDDTDGAYFYSHANLADVIVRLKDDHDGAEPCGNSVAARNLTLLAHYFDDDNYRERAAKLFKFYADVKPFGHVLPEMMSAYILHQNGLDLVAVVGPASPDTTRFLEICRKYYIPGMIILHLDPKNPDSAYNQRVQNKFKMLNGKTTVYICHDRVCRIPLTDPQQLDKHLTEHYFKPAL